MSRSNSLLALFGPLCAVALAGCVGAPSGESALDSGPGESGDSARPFTPPGAAPASRLGGTLVPVASSDLDGDGYDAGLDCDDTDPLVNPGATESDNLVDDDCDGWVDEDFVSVGDVIVTEVNRQARLGGTSVTNDGAWVEVYNTSARTVDLSNWVFARGTTAPYNEVTLDAASAPVLAPGGYAVLCDTADYEGSATAAWPLTCDYVWGDPTQSASYVGTYHDNTLYLHRDTDTVGLYVEGSRTTGTRIDSVSWTYNATSGYWPRAARFSMSLDPAYFDGTSNDDRDVWCSTTENSAGAMAFDSAWRWFDVASTTRDEYGTPGAANYDCPVDPDLDGDGYTGATDCDDTDPAINPAAVEDCDGVDQDCDGIIDDGAPGSVEWYADTDGDGYGDPDGIISACTQPAGYLADASDCDDTSAAASPAGTEVCDGLDNNCDGSIDEGSLSGTNVFFADADGDGYGDPADYTLGCLVPSGYVDNDSDCDDTSVAASPDGVEADNLADDDCDGLVDEDFIAVGDIVVSEVNRQARFGTRVVVNDGSWVEVYNTSSRTIALANWVIARGSSAPYNEVTLDPDFAPTLAPGDYAVFCDTDNYEGSAAAWPLTCDYVWGDQAEAASYVGPNHDNTFFLRRDDDTFGLYLDGGRTSGTLIDSVRWTYDAVNGYWPRNAQYSMSLDPASLDGTLNDGVDAWCSTSSNAFGVVTANTTWRWYDTTATSVDEYGTPGAANFDCLTSIDNDGDGFASDVDCDDNNASVYPGAPETCDGVDEDCDGVYDNGASGTVTYYADTDADGYGDPASTTLSCAAPAGYAADATDCDDANSTTHPGATEVCNDGVDNDCDPDPTVCEWSGSDTVKADYDFRAYGADANYSVGHSIANNGDFDGDGYDDVIVGQAYWDTGAITDNGRINVWYGPVGSSDGLETAAFTVEGDTTENSDQFGWSSRFAGDVDGDGLDDLLASAWKAGPIDAGATYLFLGGSTPSVVADAYATFVGSDTNYYAGVAIDGADINGDGRADVMVSAYGRSSYAGAVAVWDAGAVGGGDEDLATDATLLVTGAAAGDYLGYSAVFAQDLDGDGLSDLVIGAPQASSALTRGQAYVFYGVDGLSGTISASAADAVLTGSANGDRFGLSVAGLGDTDGDGVNDFAVTADKEDSAGLDAGATYVYTTAPSGSATGASQAATILTGAAAGDFYGRTVAGIGDANADGYDDMLIGATGYDEGAFSLAGAVYLMYGPLPTGTASAAGYDARFTGANSADAVGYAVAGGGDINADGYADFMTSAPSWDGFGYLNAGGVWAYFGRGE